MCTLCRAKSSPPRPYEPHEFGCPCVIATNNERAQQASYFAELVLTA
jgi:hypothetical protein